MNGAALLLDGQDPAATALVCLDERGRTVLTFGEVEALAGSLAAELAAAGVGPGDVVLTLIGSRVEWVLSMVAALHVGAVVLPCLEQLRAADLASRLEATRPRAVLAAERNRDALEGALTLTGQTPLVLEPALDALRAADTPSPPRPDLTPRDPALITFTSGTSGPAKAVVHGLKYIDGQRIQAEHWFGARPGELAWCTAAPGWSKSARNVFMAPWLRRAPALLHDARFAPQERLAILHAERPAVLCMAPTEYRLLAKRTDLDLPDSLRRLVAAGEALDPPVLHAWHDATGLWVRDGFGQTETGQLTAPPDGSDPLPGSMGRALPGMALTVDQTDQSAEAFGTGELVIADPSTVPTFFLGYLDVDTGRPVPHEGPWPTGDRVRQDADGNLFFVGRGDDVIVSSGYRIGPFEVESVLVDHPAVAEAAAVAAPDPERGSVVRAVVVLRDGHEPGDALAAELQAHVRERTAPYKYPRVVDFVDELPKTPSGKVRRALLRDAG
ncbi:MAG: AMP-binding protein [Solirubrobacteraceae bacterium]|nr:AMP-binding protein [Patulibacter sp.]